MTNQDVLEVFKMVLGFALIGLMLIFAGTGGL